MINDELNQLPALAWMPSRIPVRDALVTFVPKGVEFSKDLIPPSYEQRWYPQRDGSSRLVVPFDGGPFNSELFHIEPGGWDHTTCDFCNARIPALTICYVTRFDPYVALCADCYLKHVVNRLGLLKLILWHAKKLVGFHAAA